MRPISVVIPAYNAADTICWVLERLFSQLENVEVIVVDDGSTDETAAVVEAHFSEQVRLIRHRRNRGYGAALKTGLLTSKNPIVVSLDADGQHDPADIPYLVESLKEGVEMVVGARKGLMHTPLWRQPGKTLIIWLAQFLTGRYIPDLNSGFRVFYKEVALKYLHLCPNGFSFSSTLTLALLNQGHEVVFVPIKAYPRQSQDRSKVSVRTGFETILLVLRLMTLFNPLRVFLPVSFLFIFAGLAWGLPYLWMGHGLSTGALLFLLTGILIFFFGLLADQIAELRKERYE